MALPVVKGSRYTTILPSTGAKIEYRPYNVGEEKLLMVALESKDQNMIIRTLKDVMEGCIFDKVDFSRFTVFDFEKLFFESGCDIDNIINIAYITTKNKLDTLFNV